MNMPTRATNPSLPSKSSLFGSGERRDITTPPPKPELHACPTLQPADDRVVQLSAPQGPTWMCTDGAAATCAGVLRNVQPYSQPGLERRRPASFFYLARVQAAARLPPPRCCCCKYPRALPLIPLTLFVKRVRLKALSVLEPYANNATPCRTALYPLKGGEYCRYSDRVLFL
jgi:hypothetical protein